MQRKMELSEGSVEFLKQLAEKKNSLHKAMLMLMLKSKDLDGRLDYFNGCVIDLKSRRNDLESDRDSLTERNENLDAFRESLGLRMKEIECREEEFCRFQKAQVEEFKMKVEQLAESRIWVVGALKEYELKEEWISEQKKSMEVLMAKFQVEKQEFEDIKNSACKDLNEIRLKERNIECRSKELYKIQDSIERHAKELYSKEGNVEMREQQLKIMQQKNEDCRQKIDVVARELDCARKLIEERSEKLDSKEKELNLGQKYVQKGLNDLHVRNRQLKSVEELLEKNLTDQSIFFERKAKQLEEQFNDIESTKNQVEEWCRELASKEKKLEEWKKYFELNQKQIENRCKDFESNSKQIVVERKQLDNSVDFRVKIGQVESIPASNLPTMTDSIDGRCLQLYLNDTFKNYESSSSEVYRVLGLSSDPPNLVLDAMEGFYSPHLLKKDVEFERSVVRKSCILMLEQLMRFSCTIQPNVKKRALTLAGEWNMKLKVFPRDPQEVLAFILLLASYDLASNFDAYEVLQLLKFVKPDRMPDLCRFLGLKDKIPDFVRDLIERRLHLEAISYIFALHIGCEFPPANLLDGYISYEVEAAGKILEEGLYCIEARETACQKELNALKAVMSCVKLHKLKSQYPVRKIKARVEQLENRRIHLQSIALSPSPKSQLEERCSNKQ